MSDKSILCLGNAVLDQIFSVPTLPGGPGKFFADAFLEAGGGPAATAAVAVARLGLRATLWARLGDDAAGDRIAAELRTYGVGMDGCQRIAGAISAMAAVVVDARGERMIVCFNDAALPSGVPDWLPLDQIDNFDAVLVDSRWPSAGAAVLREAATRGVPSVLDADLNPSATALPLLAPLADHVVFSEGGLRQYTGEEDAEAGLRSAAKRMRGIAYVTLGGEGCLWLEGDAVHRCPAFAVKVVDTTGAGDVFHGAFAVALVQGLRGQEALRFAAAAAALKCTRQGGRQGIPQREQLEAFLRDTMLT